MNLKTSVLLLISAAVFSVGTARLLAEPATVVLGSRDFRDAQREDCPHFGISFAGPKGWSREPEALVNRIARWAKRDADGRTVAVMQLEHDKVTRSMDEELKALSSKLTFKSVRSIKVGDESGFYAQAATAKEHVQYFQTSRGGVKYVAVLLRSKENAADFDVAQDADTLKTFVDNWKWVDLEEPFSKIAFMDKAVPFLGGEISMNLPIEARPDTVEDPRTQLHFALINLKTHDDEFRVRTYLQRRITPAELSETAANKMPLESRLVWEELGNQKAISGWVKVGITNQAPIWFAFGLAPIKNNRSVMLHFITDRKEEAVQKKYLEVATRILQSVES